MPKLIILRGLPASGKSTFATAWVEESPCERVRVNRDSIRRQLGPYWVPSREGLVTDIENFMICSALSQEYDVVVDATNLRGTARFTQLIKTLSVTVDLEVKDFTDVPVEVCIERDRNRPESVGEEVIRNFHKKYLNG